MEKLGSIPKNGNGESVLLPQSNLSDKGKWRGENIDILLTMQKGLYDHARERGISSGAIEPEETIINVLKEHAEKMAGETYRRAYNPAENVDDKLKEDEFKRNQKELEEAILGVKHAKAELSRREDEEAKVKTKVPKEPEFPVFTICFGTAVIALTVAPTLHDTIFASFGNDWAWALGIVTGTAWGAFVSYSILDGGRDSEEQTLLNRLGLICGIGMAVALGLIRLMNAAAAVDYVVAFAFTLLEIFVAIGLEAVARKYHRQHNDFSLKAAAANEAIELVKNAGTELSRRQDDVQKLTLNHQCYIDYVSERELRSVQKSELVASATRAVIDGYNDGIEFNRGKILGIRK